MGHSKFKFKSVGNKFTWSDDKQDIIPADDDSEKQAGSDKETGDTDYITLTIPSGSYDILELSDKVKELLEANSTNTLTYTFTYDEINNTLDDLLRNIMHLSF